MFAGEAAPRFRSAQQFAAALASLAVETAAMMPKRASDRSLSQMTAVFHVVLFPAAYLGLYSVGIPAENKRPIKHQ